MRLFWNKYRRNPILDVNNLELLKPAEIQGAKRGSSWGEYEVTLRDVGLIPLGHYGRKGEGAPVQEGIKVFIPSNTKRICDHLPTVLASISEPHLRLVPTDPSAIVDAMAEGLGNMKFPHRITLTYLHLYTHEECEVEAGVAGMELLGDTDINLPRFVSNFPRIRAKTRSWRNALGLLFLNGCWCRVRDGLIKKVYAEGYDPLQRAADGRLEENGLTIFKKTVEADGKKRLLFYRPDRSKVYVCDEKGAFLDAMNASRIEFVSNQKIIERVEEEVDA